MAGTEIHDSRTTVAGGRERQTRLPENPHIQKLLGQEPTKSRVVPPAAGVTGEFKTVEQQDPLLSSQTITIKATRIAALAHDPPRWFIEIDKNLIVMNGDIFEHLAPEMMCPAWLYDEMALPIPLSAALKLLLTTCSTCWRQKQIGVSTMISTRRAWLTCCLFPSSVGQSNRSLQGFLQCLTFAGC